MTGQTIILAGDVQRQNAKQLIDRAPVGAVVNVREATRTLDQNAKLWAMLSDVSRAKPEGRKHTTEVWKCLFMQACGHEVQFLMGLDGNPFPSGFKSSKLSKRQMCELIDFIDAWGSERGVVWSAGVEVAA
jgi:hypothetical protein